MTAPKRRAPAWAWVSTTYFAEGFPYSLTHSMVEVLFTELGASLQAIGLTSLLHIPWNLKFLWAPLLDGFGTKRAWLGGIEAAMCLLVVALVASLTTGGLAGPTLLFAALAVLAATHDIAIDGYYLEALDDEAQARWVGIRAPAYRVALWVAGGPMLVLVGVGGFPLTFAASAALLAALTLFHVFYLPEAEAPRNPIRDLLTRRSGVIAAAVVLGGGVLAWLASPGPSTALSEWGHAQLPQIWWVFDRLGLSGLILVILLCAIVAGLVALPTMKRRIETSDSFYARAFTSFLDKPRVGLILWFVLFFRTGESFLEKMRYPFFKSLGMTAAEYGVTKSIGLLAAIVGPIIGGWLISRHGLRRWIWPLVIAQNGLNLSYWVLAVLGVKSVPVMTFVITLEMFGAGLGTAVFMVYLMRCPLPGYKAAHYAILSALMSASFTMAAVVSGFLADAIGFAGYFLFTVAASVPGMVVIPFLPHLDDKPTPPPEPAPEAS